MLEKPKKKNGNADRTYLKHSHFIHALLKQKDHEGIDFHSPFRQSNRSKVKIEVV